MGNFVTWLEKPFGLPLSIDDVLILIGSVLVLSDIIRAKLSKRLYLGIFLIGIGGLITFFLPKYR